MKRFDPYTKPSPPVEPDQTLTRLVEAGSFSIYSEMPLDEFRAKIPEDATHIWFRGTSDFYDGGVGDEVEVRTYKQVTSPNPHYTKQRKLYEQQKAVYADKVKEWEQQKREWEERQKAKEDQKKAKSIEFKRKLLKKLKRELGED